MQHFWGNRTFFQNIDYSHFCSQPHTVSYDHKIIQDFKGSPRTQHTKFRAHSGVKCPILTIIRDEYLPLMIVKMGNFTPEWDQKLVCYVMIRIHAYLESVESIDYGNQKSFCND